MSYRPWLNKCACGSNKSGTATVCKPCDIKRRAEKRLNTDHTPLDKIAFFWPKVDKSDGDDACWIWLGRRNTSGYGRFIYAPSTRWIFAHRFSAMLAGMNIRKMLVCHTCDNPSCVNPKHLFVGTNRDNMLDCVNKGRNRNARKDTCPRGHVYNDVCTRPDGRTFRACTICRIDQQRERRRTAAWLRIAAERKALA